MSGRRVWRLADKLNLLTISMILLTASILVLLMYRYEFGKVRQDLVEHNTTLAGMVATNAEFGIYTEDRDSLVTLLGSLSLNKNIVSAAIVDSRGKLLAAVSFRGESSPPTEKEVETLLGRGTFFGEGSSISLVAPVISQSVAAEGDPFTAEVPDKDAGTAIGHVILQMDTLSAQERLREYLSGALLATLLLLLLGIAVTLTVTRRIISPLGQLGDAAREIASGRFEQSVDISGGDEVAELSRSFQGMVENLNKYRRQVDERTEELVETNRKMEEEIHQRKRVEAQLLHSQKMEAIGHLAGGIAHDLNNILMAITSFTTLLQIDVEEESPASGHVEEILSSAERASQLTRNLLAFSRKQVIRPEPLDLNEVVEGVFRMLTSLIGENVAVDFTPGDEELRIVADRGQIEQVIMNLATNARDAMPEGGVFSLQLDRRIIDEEFVKLHGWGKPGEYALLSLSDSGEGIDKEEQEKIFEPFFTTKNVDEGTGLGLSIVYGIIKQHGGYVDLYSEPGRGARFIIYLPIDKSVEKVAARKARTADGDMLKGSETILFAEDEDKVRSSLGALLERYGYRVILAENGAEAVKRYDEQDGRIDLLLFDVMMPVKNGKEAYDEIVARGGNAKAVFLSGYSDKVLSPELAGRGDVPLISKPIAPLGLLKRIRDLLDGHPDKGESVEPAKGS